MPTRRPNPEGLLMRYVASRCTCGVADRVLLQPRIPGGPPWGFGGLRGLCMRVAGDACRAAARGAVVARTIVAAVLVPIDEPRAVTATRCRRASALWPARLPPLSS